MNVHYELKKIRPGLGRILGCLLRLLALSAIVAGYYRYYDPQPSNKIPALLVCVICLAFICVGSLWSELRYRFLLGRLLRKVNRAR